MCVCLCIAGMGGNVGIQSSTVVVRGLATGYVETATFSHLVLREIALGASLGLLFGFQVGGGAGF